MSDIDLPVDQPARQASLQTKTSFLVQAPAGSGKTELLTQRMMRLLAEVEQPENILAITFTIAATAEMRARVLDKLKEASTHEAQTDPKLALARAVLAHSDKCGWNILQQPQRLNIQTIDAVCLTIAHQTPVLARLGGSLSPTDKPQPLYDLAARRTLAHLGEDTDLSKALRALLQLRSASLQDCQSLIAGMLDKRDQWGRVLPIGRQDESWAEVRVKLEKPLQRLHSETVKKAQSLFARYATFEPDFTYLLAHACDNLEPDSEFMLLRKVSHFEHLISLEHWQCFANFLLTKGSTWRQAVDRNTGFAGGKQGKAAKEKFAAAVEKLKAQPALLEMLKELRALPPAAYSDEESQTLQHLMVILRYAVAELRLVFAERELVDFVELGLAATQVLQNEQGNASEIAADVAGRWSHVLVDEFQDTSRSQYKLLTLLAEGWESAGPATCFLVGDPMQSIYMFRQAEVELFERTKRHGLGEGTANLSLSPLGLQTNFRSHAALVDRLNEMFELVFAPPGGEDNPEEYRVDFVRSVAADQRPRSKPGVRIWPSLQPSKPTAEQSAEAFETEAGRVLSIIEQSWPELEAKRTAGITPYRIAVLVRAKGHLALIAKKLRLAGIPFRAVEIEQLGERQEVRDLAALTRALLHPMDRIAWLTVLRAPWCGLTLADLHTLCGNDDPAFKSQPLIVLLRERVGLLTEDGQLRARRVHAVLETGVRGVHRQVALARWVERTWATLGGNACVDRTGYENARTFFAMLEGLGPDAGGLEQRMEQLCAQPDPLADERWCVQLMTIHKAKGLGFDVVIVPALERQTASDGSPLVRWIEQTRLVGPKEEEEQAFVVAPIGRNGEASGIYEWIGKQQTKRQDDETRRLFYVAATRASEELHLLGTAKITTNKDGEETLSPGYKHSLLGIAWQALKPAFDELHAQRSTVVEQTVKTLPEPASHISLQRLPVGWHPDAVAVATGSQTSAETEKWERPRGSLVARAFGTIVHALLEDLAAIADGDWQKTAGEVEGWRGRALALLRAAGLPRKEAESQAALVVKALLRVTEDSTGRWIMAARADAETEVSWSAWESADGLQTLRGDRMFWAGPEPESSGDSYLWIVDFKTGTVRSGSVETWLAEEKQKYLPQLEAYADLMRKVHGEGILLRKALYFPLVGRLVWW